MLVWGVLRDAVLAEDLAQDALVSVRDQWPKQDIPDSPGAWLIAVAKRRAVDFFRHKDGRLLNDGNQIEAWAAAARADRHSP